MTLITGKALRFNGIADHVVIPYDASIQGFDVITLEVWLYLDDTTAGYLVHTQTPATYDGYFLYYTGTKIQFRFGKGSSPWQVITGGTTLLVGTWYHIVAIYDNSYLRLYLQGIPDATPVAAAGLDIATSLEDVFLGAHSSNGTYLKGVLDEVRISEVARTESEITANWNGGAGRPLLPDSDTKALYHLNEGTGGIAHDKTGINDGDLSGCTWVDGKIKHTGAVWDFFTWG